MMDGQPRKAGTPLIPDVRIRLQPGRSPVALAERRLTAGEFPLNALVEARDIDDDAFV
jgi:hypothetical protein